jgi:outer membrane immunogenic protein
MRVFRALAFHLCCLALAHPALADDPPRGSAPARVQPRASTWSGGYIGVSGGLGWRGKPIRLSGTNGIDEFIKPAGIPDSIAGEATGPIAGGQAGYWHQSGAVGFGLEADFSAARIEKTEDHTGIVGVERYTRGEKSLDWLGSLRGRIGFAVGSNAVIYGTGGAAIGRANSAVMLTTTTKNNMAGCIAANIGVCIEDSQEETLTGWIAGGGVEFRTGSRASLRVEYLFYDLGEISTEGADNRFPAGQFPTLMGVDPVKGSVVRAGINFRF